MKIRFYAYPTCSTCKKAHKFLTERGRGFEAIDITQAPPSKKDLKAMLARYDGNIRKLFNTSGQVYREQKIGDKLKSGALDETKALDLLAANGKLIKRPFLVVDGEAKAVGFDPAEWKKLI